MKGRGGVAALAIAGAVTVAVVLAGRADRRAIPPRDGAAVAAAEDPTRLLAGGRLVFSDDFERPELGAAWTARDPDWRLEGGWLHSTAVDNRGAWLAEPLPERVRVEFEARSEPLPDGKPFPGDIKCEIFARTPEHEAGYVIINGGWHNQLDVIARLDEHGTDRKEQPAAAVEPSRVYRWAVTREGGTLYWFRDGVLVMRYHDEDPVDGRYFGFNNWRTNVWFDNLRVFALE